MDKDQYDQFQYDEFGRAAEDGDLETIQWM